jgi:hypothetical protein
LQITNGLEYYLEEYGSNIVGIIHSKIKCKANGEKSTTGNGLSIKGNLMLISKILTYERPRKNS